MLRLVVIAFLGAVVTAKKPMCHWKLIDTHYYDGDAYESHPGFQLKDCKSACEGSDRCKSFNYSPKFKVCELVDEFIDKDALTYQKFYKYYKCESRYDGEVTASTLAPTVAPPQSGDGICMCRGDPHCYRFDDDNDNPLDELYVTSSCSFTMVMEPCNDDGTMPTFMINARFDRQKLSSARSHVKSLLITNNEGGFESYVLGQGLEVIRGNEYVDCQAGQMFPGQSMINQVHKSQLENAGDWDDDTEDVVVVKFANGYEVQWNGIKMFKIIAPSSKAGKMCGLCGNFDGIRPDVLTGHHNKIPSECIPKTVSKPFQSEASSNDELVASWFAEFLDNPSCTLECASEM